MIRTTRLAVFFGLLTTLSCGPIDRSVNDDSTAGGEAMPVRLALSKAAAATVDRAVKSHFQLKRTQARLVASARHCELVDAEFSP